MASIFETNLRQSEQMLQTLGKLEAPALRAATVISDALLSGRKLLACGNGGSAADASHLTTEFVCRFNQDRRPYPAISLAVHGGDLTAIGNDYAFDDLFARQVQAFGAAGDVLVAFTTSGKSENIRRALLAASGAGLHSIAMLGRDGGRCTGIAEVELLIAHPVTARIQEGHKWLLHTICEMVEVDLAAAG